MTPNPIFPPTPSPYRDRPARNATAARSSPAQERSNPGFGILFCAASFRHWHGAQFVVGSMNDNQEELRP